MATPPDLSVERADNIIYLCLSLNETYCIL